VTPDRYCTLNGDQVTMNTGGTFELHDRWSRKRIIRHPIRRSAS
jgi:hypothetical protein